VCILFVDLKYEVIFSFFCSPESVGEIAMGYASGHYNKVSAIGIAVARGAAMKKAEGNGTMVALGICFQRARYMIKQVLEVAGAADGLWIAAINSPDAVTVAGREDLIDMLTGIVKGRGFFAAKLTVTCAFHTPLMEPQEEVFKSSMKAVSGNFGRERPVVRTMSTVDGQWLERDLDVDYCWDNIRRPVLFGTAIDKILKESASENVLFLEIAPHPVLRSYILQCKGQPISLIRRPNPKVPGQNTGEHYQFLEGIGTLLTSGFKAVDLSRLCATPDGRQDFFRCNMPDYPYNKITCSSESALNRSIRLRQKPRPLSSSLFRMNLGTHPDLAGHLIFEVSLFPLSG
jgi:acyl transferase domain-containing protein